MAVDIALDPYRIFSQARAAVTAAPYPASLDYVVSIVGENGNSKESNHYRAFSRPADGIIDVAPISDEQAVANSPPPRGVDFKLTAFICGGRCETGSGHVEQRVGWPDASPDLIGVPVLDPTYAFGMKYTEKAPPETKETPPGPPVIATVSTQERIYTIRFDAISVLNGVPCYHLVLKPRRKARENRLRELWIGTSDFLPRRALLSGNFTIAPLVDVPWTVEFAVIAGAPFIKSEIAQSALFLSHQRIVRDATISFEQVNTGSSYLNRPLVEPEISPTTLVEPGTLR